MAKGNCLTQSLCKEAADGSIGGKLLTNDGALDQAGIWVSLVCLVHCLGLPLISIVIPTLSLMPEHDAVFHSIILLTILPLAYLSFYRGYKVHKLKDASIVGALGMSLLLIAFIYEESNLHSLITSLGGILLVIAHGINWRHLHNLFHASKVGEA